MDLRMIYRKYIQMKATWKTFGICLAAALALCVSSTQIFAQDAAAKFADWAPKMTPQDWTNNDQIKEMQNAQQGWMSFCLQNVDDRDASIKVNLDALKGDYPVATKAWILHILGWTGNDSCVEGIAAFLTSDEPALFDEAARALAQIASDKAIDALKKAQADSKTPEKFAPYISARDVDLSIGVETELPLALPYVSDDDYAAYMAKFDSLSADDQARALGSIRVRKDKKYLDLAVKAALSDNEFIKRAGVLALEKIATAKEFDVLYQQLTKTDRGLVETALKNVPGKDFDAAVFAALKKEKDGANLASLAGVVASRNVPDSVATLLELAKKEDCPARIQLLAAAEQLATKDNIGDFVDAFLAIPQGGDRDRAEQIVSRLCDGDATPVIAKMNNANGPQIFLLLGRVGGDAALAQIEKGLATNNPQMIALSIRALSNWPNAVVWEKLLAAAQNESYPEPVRIQALRAFIRVVSLPDDRDGIDMSDQDKLANLKKAFAIATRDDERNFVLERVGSVRTLDSVRFALEYVDTPALSNKAINAILDLAHQDYLRKQDKELFTNALNVVIEKGDKGQKDRAEGYKSNIR